MKPGYLEEKIRLFLLPIVLALAAVIVLLVVALPQFDQMKVARQVLTDSQKAAAVLQAKLSTLAALDELSQGQTLDAVIKALPLEEPYLESLSNLDALLTRHQIGFSNIKVESAPETILIKFTGSAPLSQIREFIAAANKVLPLSAAAKVEAARANDIYQAEIALRIFFKPPPKTIGRSSDPLPPLTADHLKTLSLLSEFEKIPLPAAGPETDTGGATRLFPE